MSRNALHGRHSAAAEFRRPKRREPGDHHESFALRTYEPEGREFEFLGARHLLLFLSLTDDCFLRYLGSGRNVMKAKYSPPAVGSLVGFFRILPHLLPLEAFRLLIHFSALHNRFES
jgi:hypothetical protein